MLQAERWRVQVQMRSLNFFQLTYSFQPHYGPVVDSASNRNEYQEFSWERRAFKADNLTAIYEPIV
jgi:hypothetical protein